LHGYRNDSLTVIENSSLKSPNLLGSGFFIGGEVGYFLLLFEYVIFLAMQPYIHQFADFLRLHMDSISVGLVATFLMIFGGKINGYFKKITKSVPFVARYALFVVLCSAGYAFLTSQMVKYLKVFLRTQQDMPLIGIIAGAFLVLAFLARSGKDI